jgi:hypothetical protein
MLITYDPKTQGSSIFEDELKMFRDLKPDCTEFTPDDPELTEELVQKIKKNAKIYDVIS